MIKKILKIIGITIGLYILINLINKLAAYISKVAYPLFDAIDPGNVFISNIFHSVIQATVALILIVIILNFSKKKLKDVGFNTGNIKVSIIVIITLVLICTIIQFSMGYIEYIKLNNSIQPSFPHTLRNIIGTSVFHIFFCGTSEEILCRMLIMVCFIYIFRIDAIENKKSRILYIFISAFIFMTMHISFNITPFEIAHINISKLISCFIFGAFWSLLYAKTKSIIGPIIAHNLLNFMILISEIVFCSIA